MYQNPFIPRILYGASSGYAAKAAAIGINVVLDNGFERRTWSQRDAALAQAAEYGVKIMPWMPGVGSYKDPNVDPGKTFWENWWDGKRECVERYGNDDRIYGWNTAQEPDVGKVPDPTLEEVYDFIRKYDPGDKPQFILWDQWDATGHRCKPGQFDIWTLDTAWSGHTKIESFRSTFEHLNKYYHWRDIGKPAIAHFYNYDTLEECYRVWQELVPAGVVGTMYYSASIVMANTSKGATIRAAIEAFHRSMGWWPPPEEFTTEEIVCSGCGAVLELTISSIPEKNVSRSCPICGTLAD